MGRRIRRGLRPGLELVERRELLSAITDVMAADSLRASARAGRAVAQLGGASSGGQGSGGSSSFASSITLGTSTLNQGPVLNPDGSINNMALAPTGTPKPGELKRMQFTARFVGPYSVVPGRTTTQASQTLIQGGGTSNTMRHSDVQIRIVKPIDPTLPFGGVGTVFDRNINTNSALGFDLSAPQSDVDRGGRPNVFPTVSVDVNASAGTYVEAYGQGVLNIHYIPSGKRTAGVLSQGTAIVTMHMEIYAPDASFILRNVALNP
jgi:hypothetical protein